MRPLLSAAFVLGAALVAFPATAFAGDCPVCDTASQCNRAGIECSEATPCFCVEWDMSPGCGALTRICCPGQGCNIEGGRPSCEGDRCTVIDGPYTGGDAGMPSMDAGPLPGTDAGGSMVDAAGRDGGTTTPRDAGTTVSMPRDGGCDCSTSGSAGGGAIAALAMLYALWRRRQR